MLKYIMPTCHLLHSRTGAGSVPPRHMDGAVLRAFRSREYLSVMKYLLANWIIFR